jgi:putative membrane protein
MPPKTLAIILLSFLAVVLLAQNTQPVSFQFFFWKVSMSRIIMIFFALLTGYLLGYLSKK